MTETLNKLHIHVGVISGRDALPPTLEAELSNALKQIDRDHPRRRIALHHGCDTDADETAHRVAKDLRWQIAAHPVRRASGGSYRLPAEIMRGLTMLFPPKPAEERDADIISECDFIVAVQLADENTITLLSRAEAAGRVIYLGEPSHRHLASATRSIPTQPANSSRRAPVERAQRGLPKVRGTSVHVGVLTGGLSIKQAQAAALASEVKRVPVPKGGKLILHHGCASGADAAAHQTARAIKGWEIHGHPASDSASGQPPTGMLCQLHKIHEVKPRDERDADIVRASTVLIFVEPGPPGAKALRAAAAAAGKKIINLPALAPKKRTIDEPSPAGKVTSVPARTGREPKRAPQPTWRTRKMASYGPREAREARIAERRTAAPTAKVPRPRQAMATETPTSPAWQANAAGNAPQSGKTTSGNRKRGKQAVNRTLPIAARRKPWKPGGVSTGYVERCPVCARVHPGHMCDIIADSSAYDLHRGTCFRCHLGTAAYQGVCRRSSPDARVGGTVSQWWR